MIGVGVQGTVSLGNFRLVEVVGAGGHGEVWRAEVMASFDTPLGERVAAGAKAAVKLLRVGAEPERVLREARALRLCPLRGVVPLWAFGEHRGRPVLVTEFIEGEHFPGRLDTDRPGVCVLHRLIGLLQVLRGVHDAGILHRDLKPGNVLVTDAGSVVLLDFSLARGAGLGDTITADGGVVGSVAYMAPEQVESARVGPQADLWAAAAMAYAALCGRIPHRLPNEGNVSPVELLRRRIHTPITPLSTDQAPGWPSEALHTLHRMLSTEPQQRPRSAMEALEGLSLAASSSFQRLPFLGSRAQILRTAEWLLSGRGGYLVGPRGCGRTRFLEELQDELIRSHCAVRWAVPSDEPFGNLMAMVGAPGPMGLRDAAEWFRGALHAAARQGVVWLINGDVWPRVDSESRARLSDWLAELPVLVELPPGERRSPAFEPLPLSAADLRTLFAGYDDVWHVPEDAARALWDRTGGMPARVHWELERWRALGWARRSGDTFEVHARDLLRLPWAPLGRGEDAGNAVDTEDPDATQSASGHAQNAAAFASAGLLPWLRWMGPDVSEDALCTITGWPAWRVRAHLMRLSTTGEVLCRRTRWVAALPPASSSDAPLDGRTAAAAWPPGHERRLAALVACGDSDSLAAECLAAIPGLVRKGRLSRAVQVAGLGLVYSSCLDERESLADWLALGSLHQQRSAAIWLAERELMGAPLPQSRRTAARLALLRATAVRMEHRQGPLPAWPDAGDLAAPELRAWAVVGLARGLPPTTSADEQIVQLEGLLESLLDCSAAVIQAAESAILAQWAWRGADFSKAAALFDNQARHEDYPHRQLTALANAVRARTAALQFAKAAQHAKRARKLAEFLRAPVIEAAMRAELRSLEYRRGRIPDADPLLVEALLHEADADFLALVNLTEAAIAWRRGHTSQAASWATQAAEAWAHRATDSALLAGLLAELNGAPPPPWPPQLSDPSANPVAAQAVALACLLGRSEATAERVQRAKESAQKVPANKRSLRYNVLSPAEILTALKLRTPSLVVPEEA